jgi:hypothetical protein
MVLVARKPAEAKPVDNGSPKDPGDAKAAASVPPVANKDATDSNAGDADKTE